MAAVVDQDGGNPIICSPRTADLIDYEWLPQAQKESMERLRKRAIKIPASISTEDANFIKDATEKVRVQESKNGINKTLQIWQEEHRRKIAHGC